MRSTCLRFDKQSYMSFRLVSISVTLSDLERRNGPYFSRYFTEFGNGRLHYFTEFIVVKRSRSQSHLLLTSCPVHGMESQCTEIW